MRTGRGLNGKPATALAATVMILMSASCGSKKDPSNSNFKTAIQAELDKQPVCIAATLPEESPSWNGKLKPLDQLEPLVKSGLAKRTEAMVQRSSFDFMLEDKRPKQVPGYSYDLSEMGKKYLKQVRSLGGTTPDLCYGRRQIVDIVRFTEPSPAMGMTVSEVSYSWKLVDIAAWARNPDIKKMFYTTQFLNAADVPQEARMELVLSSDGWHAANTF